MGFGLFGVHMFSRMTAVSTDESTLVLVVSFVTLILLVKNA
jgi:hypothetical protein